MDERTIDACKQRREKYWKFYSRLLWILPGECVSHDNMNEEGDHGVTFPNREVRWFLSVENARGGSYEGSSHTRANREAIMEMAEERAKRYKTTPEGMGIWLFDGRYSSRIYLETAKAGRWYWLVEILDRLKVCPLVDEDKHSEIEYELKRDQWDDWLKQDVKQWLESLCEVDLDGVEDEVFWEWFYCTADDNGQWSAEGAGEDCMYIDYRESLGRRISKPGEIIKRYELKLSQDELMAALPGAKKLVIDDRGSSVPDIRDESPGKASKALYEVHRKPYGLNEDGSIVVGAGEPEFEE
jgi:hypothetical protein